MIRLKVSRNYYSSQLVSDRGKLLAVEAIGGGYLTLRDHAYTQKEAAELIAYLQVFVDTGRLSEPGEGA